MMRSLLSLCAILALTLPSFAQDVSVRLSLRKGTVIFGTTSADKIPVKTKYGNLEVPTESIRSIRFGIHYDVGEKQLLLDYVKQLDSQNFKERERATNSLIAHGQPSLPLLPPKMEGQDLELVKRVQTIKDRITEANKDLLPHYDTICTVDFDIKGEILWDQIQIKPNEKEFGLLKAKVINIASIQFQNYKSMTELSIQGDGQWHDTGFLVEMSSKLNVTADGTVDIWPQQPGQYVATPKGAPNGGQGKGGRFIAGSLIGRIGTGEEFLVGDSFSLASSSKTGNLYLKVVENAWNTPNSGAFQVTIKSE